VDGGVVGDRAVQLRKMLSQDAGEHIWSDQVFPLLISQATQQLAEGSGLCAGEGVGGGDKVHSNEQLGKVQDSGVRRLQDPAQEGDAVNVLPVHVQQLGVEGGDSWEQVLELEHHLSLDGMHAGTLQAGHLALHSFPDILGDGLRPRNIT